MCCRTSVYGLDRGIAEAILALGKFSQTDKGLWVREVEEEAVNVRATFSDAQDSMTVWLYPSILSWHQHQDKRNAASIMFEIAARYAEKVGGLVMQEGINVYECKEEGMKRHLAQYPQERLDFSRVCPGWQAVFIPS